VSDTVFLSDEPWVHAQCNPYLPWIDEERLIGAIFWHGISIAPLLGNFSAIALGNN